MNQVKALYLARKAFGNTAYTEHTVNYCLVGYKRTFAIGTTFTEALGNLVIKTNGKP